MEENHNKVVYETLGSLKADMKNINQRFTDMAKSIGDITNILQEMKENSKKIERLEAAFKENDKKHEDMVRHMFERFGMAYEHREEIRKNLLFLAELQNTKKKFVSSFIGKVAEWSAIIFITTYLAPKIAQLGGLN